MSPRTGPLPTADRLAAIDALFQAVLEASRAERQRLLAAHDDDPDLVREVLALLEYEHENDPSTLLLSPQRLARVMLTEPDADGACGERVGAYRLLRQVGRGGMGVVWLGERADGTFEQRVALKILPAGSFSKTSTRRFERERQILAHLNHDNIARLLDGGVDERGRPYLVMELVEGRPIGEYCDAEALSLEDRLRLVISAARAVQAAHRNLIVHCDLKPANILVTDQGVVKLLDFGIAELTDPGEVQELSGELRRLTPEYASPESLTGGTITTASDVYQLGLLAFELSCGCRARGEIDCLESPDRQGLELVPPAPSAALLELAAQPSAKKIAERRTTSVARLRRRLTGDLDSILLKALAPDPQDRYSSADDLADDLQRFLDRRPVEARGGGRAYRMQRLIRRHPAISALMTLLLLAAVGLVEQTRVARQERNRAELEAQAARAVAERAQQISDFLVSMLTDASLADLRDELTVAELLDRGTRRIRTELAESSPARSEMEEILGRVYLSLGRGEESQRLLSDAVARKRAAGDPDELGDALIFLATTRISLGQHEAAKQLLYEALELQGSAGNRGTQTMKRAATLTLLSYVHGMLGELDPMLELRRESLAIRQRLGDGRDLDTAQGLNDLCYAYKDVGDYERARDLCSRALDILHAYAATDDYMRTLNNLALVEIGLGNLDDAARHNRTALRWVEANYPQDYPLNATLFRTAGSIATLRGDLPAAQTAFDKARGIMGRLLPADHRDFAWLDILEAQMRVRSGAPEAAERQARRALELERRTHGENQHTVLQGRIVLAEAMIAQGRTAQAALDLADVERRLRVGRTDDEIWLKQCRKLLADVESVGSRQRAGTP